MNERIRLLSESEEIITRAKSADRALTDDERAKVRATIEAVKRLDLKAEIDDDAGLRRRLARALREGPTAGELGRFTAKSAAVALADKIGGGYGKALAPSGAEVAPAGLTELTPLSLTRPATSLLAVVSAQVLNDPPTFAYLHQTSRVNNAAAVPTGSVKPTSTYALERVEDRLRVVAHLSEPIDKYWLQDTAELRLFVEQELTYGVDVAVEAALLNGNGVGESPRGMLQTTGILSQAFSTDPLESLRKSLTLLQLNGAESPTVALHPSDWEAIALLRTTTNAFIASDAQAQSVGGGNVAPPTGAQALMSWGVPVVLSSAVPVGTGVMFDPSAVTLYTDGTVAVEWDTTGDDFTKNQITARAETRIGVAVKRPSRIVSVDLSAA